MPVAGWPVRWSFFFDDRQSRVGIPAIFTCCGLIRVIREGGKRRGKRGEGRKRGEGKREKRKKIVLFHL